MSLRPVPAGAVIAAMVLAASGGAGCNVVLGTGDVILGACFPGEVQCRGDTVQTCDGQGAWQDSMRCTGRACQAGACVPACPDGDDLGCTQLVSWGVSGLAGDGASPPVNETPAFVVPRMGVSGDGRFVVFSSAATDLVAGDRNGVADAFVRDMRTGAITRVSVAPDGTEADGETRDVAISADGLVVAFVSDAENLVPDDSNGRMDAFAHVLSTHTTEIVSVDAGGPPTTQGGIYIPSLSADGAIVAFETSYPLVAADTIGGAADIYVRDRQAQTTTPVSVDSQGHFGVGMPSGCTEGGGANATTPSVSADGRYVAFIAGAGLVAGDDNACSDAYLRDRLLGKTIRLSVSSTGTQGTVVPGLTGAVPVALSGDGNLAVFGAGYSGLVPGDTNGKMDIFLRDVAAMTTTRLDLAPGGVQSHGTAESPTISADGRYVAFLSDASDLVAGDTNGVRDAFVVDRSTGVIERVSVGPGGAELDLPTDGVVISPGGDHVVFATHARVVPADQNAVLDVYLRRLR